MPPKLVCAFHPAQPLTNFCMNKQCLLPLCPTCVKIHSLEHMMMQTIPRYEQISELTNQIASNLSQDISVIEENISMVCAAQTALTGAKMKAKQVIEVFKKEMIAELEVFCEGVNKEVEGVWGEKEEGLRGVRDRLSRNLAAVKGLRECLHGEKPMRAVIKYIGRFVRDKVHYTKREIEENLSSPAAKIQPKIQIKPDPIKSLRQLLQTLIKTNQIGKIQNPADIAVIDLHDELVSDRKKQKSQQPRSHLTLITHNDIVTTTPHQSTITQDLAINVRPPMQFYKTQPRPTRQPYKSLPHNQRTPVVQVARHCVGIYYNNGNNNPTSEYFSSKTIEHEYGSHNKHEPKMHTSFSGDLEEPTPKSYHNLGTRRPSRVESVTISSTLNTSVRESSEEKRGKAGLMLVQQRPKGRKISFNRNIRMFKQNRDPAWITIPSPNKNP